MATWFGANCGASSMTTRPPVNSMYCVLLGSIVVQTSIVPAPSPFGLVCVRHEPAGLRADGSSLDVWNRELLERVNAAGDVYLTHTVLGGRYTLRLAVGQWQTERADVLRAWERIRAAATR